MAPDRDERAPYLCAETLLTLIQNNYVAPADLDDLRSPKRQLFAVRSLALGVNFLGGRRNERAADGGTTPEDYGEMLAKGSDLRGSANLALAQQALQGLVDPETERGEQAGSKLLRPFHESLLWFDARRSGRNSSLYTVRKVHMRGTGITLARMLLDPPDPDSARLGQVTVKAIKQALTAPTPLALISDVLENALPPDQVYTNRPIDIEKDEKDAWTLGADPRLAELCSRLCRHAEGVMLQGHASDPAKLWQLRCILALDFAVHILRTAWEATATPDEDRFLLLSFGGAPRAGDALRQKSEDSYARARIRLGEATVATLGQRMKELKTDPSVKGFAGEFRDAALRSDTDSVASQLEALPVDAPDSEYARLARVAAEVSTSYGRGSEDGFRVLLESVGMVSGGSRYRYLTAGTDLLAAMVGALSAQMPMSSRDFMNEVRKEWGLVINLESAADTSLRDQLDGADLARNVRLAERLMSDAGLALGLSDRTTIVGERADRRQP
ncbi:hypothetical protein [Branchiibius cervicis]|uniref:Uncharacterized protein n=1 Tax=Branchiibius cervicis TaxID=908252 RepID=A0ABW2AW87_9MICO